MTRHADRHHEDHRGRPDQVGDRPDDDDRQEAGDRDEHPQDAEDAAADILREVLLELRLRRDGDEPIRDPGEEGDDHDDGKERRHPRQVEAARRVRALEEAADRPGGGKGRQQDPQHDEAALDDPPAGEVLAVGVEQQDPGHDPEPERQDDDREALGLESEGLLGEVGTEDAEHADQRGGDRQVDQRPADRSVGTDEAEPFAELAERRFDGLFGIPDPEAAVRVGLGRRRRRRGRQRDAEDHGQEVQRGDDGDDRLRTREVDHQRAEQCEADGERRVERQREDAVRGEQLTARHQGRDHRQLGRGEEDGDRRDEDVEQEDDREIRPGEIERHERGATQEVRGDQDQPPIDAVDVDARDRREQDGRDEERQDQQADRGVRAGRVDDDDGQSEQDHVAADLGRHLRQPEAQEAAVLEDREGVPLVVGLAGRDSLGHADGPSEGVGDAEIAAVIAASPRETNPASRRFEDAALEQDVAAAGLAAQADVGAEAIDRARCSRHTGGRVGA